MSDLLTIEDCGNLVKTCLGTDQVKIIDYTVKSFQNQNFSLKVTVNYQNKEKTLQFFAKSIVKRLKFNQSFCDDVNFEGEITPKFYYGTSEFLFFEDLSWQGYKNYNFEDFDLNHMKVVLKVMAKFHAASFAHKLKSKKEDTRRLNDGYKIKRSNVDWAKATELISTLLDDKNQENLSAILENLEQVQSSAKIRTLSQDNLISKNIMFKYSNDLPVDCKFINFECKYSSPVCDVLQLIFLNSNEKLRQHHYHSLLQFYYKDLEEELKQFHLNVENILPSVEWQMQVHQFLPLIKLECVLKTKSELMQELREDLNCRLVSRQDIYSIIRNKLKTSNYNLKMFEVVSAGAISGFLGDYCKLQIRVSHNDEDITINCFVKCMPKSIASKEVVEDSNGFFKEAFVYETLIPKFQEFGIDIISECLPACYFQRSKDMIIFEDLNLLGYQPTSARNPYSLDTLCMIMKKVARFHASAFVYEERMSEKLERPYRLNKEYEEFFKEAIIIDDLQHSGGKLMENGVRAILHCVDLFPELKTEKNVQNFEKFWPKLKNLFYSTLTASDQFRNVVSHGDLWSSNILIKSEGDKAIDCSFVDYQLLRYCPPGHDFLSVLHLTTIRSTRLKHEEELRRVYYNELGLLLKMYNYDIEKVFRYENFIGGINLMRPQMLLQAAIYCMFSMCTPEQISLLLSSEEESKRVFFEDRKDFLGKMCKISDIYRSRLKDRILDIYEYCNTL